MRRALHAAVLAAMSVVAVLLPQLAAGDPTSHRRSSDWEQPSAAPPPPPPELDSAFAGERGRVNRARAARDTGAARLQRERSRSQYRGVSGPAALELGRREFPAFFDGRIWQGPKAPSGGKISRYLSDHSFLVEQPNGKTYLAQSLQPVLAKDPSGHQAPIDTRLERSGSAFEPVNTLAPTTIAGEAGGQSSLQRAGVSFHLVGAEPSARASVDLDKAFYANALQDSDLAVAPVADGLEVLLQLRSQGSPEDPALQFDLPAGGELRLRRDAPALGAGPLPKPAEADAEVVVGGQSVVTIHAPAAADADGVQVPASYRVQGNRLIIHVPHDGGDWHYPILVDPLVVDDYLWRDRNGTGNGGSAYTDQHWAYRTYGTGSSAYDCSQLQCAPNGALNGPGLYLSSTSGPYPADGTSRAEWYWQAPRNSNIVRVDWRSGGLTTGGNTCLYAFVTSTAALLGPPNLQTRCGTMTSPSWYPVSCVDIAHPCGDIGYSMANNQAVFGMQMKGSQPAVSWSLLGGAYINLWEGGRPTVPKLLTAGSTLASQTQWTPPSGWLSASASTQTFRALTHDNELGMNHAELYIDGAFAGTGGSLCSGKYSNECPYDLVLPDPGINAGPFSYSPGAYSEGVHHASVVASDIVGNPSTGTGNQEWDVKVDKSGPALTLPAPYQSGEGGYVRAGPLAFNATAVDAKAGIATAGVRSLELKVNDQRQQYLEQPCTQDCSFARTLTADLSAFGEGARPKISVVATDWAGNGTTKDFYVTVDRTAPSLTLDGSLAPSATNWIQGPDQALRLLAEDGSPGSGAVSAKLTIDGTDIATRTQTCAAAPCPMLVDYTVDASVYYTGDHQASLTVLDGVGNQRAYSWPIHVDSQLPTLTISGNLHAAQAHATASSNYTLQIDTGDGSSVQPQAGVNDVEVRIDDQAQASDGSTCAFEPCTLSRTIEFTPQQLDPGAHAISVVATDRAGNQTTQSWTVTTSADADALCPVPTTTAQVGVSSPPQVLTATEAAATAQAAAPPVVAPSQSTTYDDQTLSPSLTSSSCDHTVISDDTLSPTAIDTVPGGSLHVDTAWGDLTMTPTTITGATTPAQVTAGDAVISANTSPATDTIVRPTALGAETITEIRGPSAPQTFTWDVQLPEGETLQKLSDGSVAVVSPTMPDATVAEEPDAPASTTVAQGVAVAPVYGTTPVDPATGTESRAMPTGVDESQMPPLDDGTTPADPPAVQPDPALSSLSSVQKVPVAQAQLEAGTTVLDHAQSTISDDVVAVIREPWAREADGDPVPASLDVNGSQLTMTVSHHAGDAYPVTADPDLVDCKKVNPCGHFHGRKAAKYARYWAKRYRNPIYYPHYGNDCTNYVSASLRAGGMWWMRNWAHGEGSWWSRVTYSFGAPHYDDTKSWTLVQVLYHHLFDYHLAHRIDHGSHARIGDLVFYDFGVHGDEWDHVDIVTGKRDSNEPLVSGHTKDKRNENFYRSVVPRNKDENGKLVSAADHFNASDHRLHGKRWTYVFVRVTKQGANIAR